MIELRNAAAHDTAKRFVHLRALLSRPGIRSTLRDSDLQLAVYQVEGWTLNTIRFCFPLNACECVRKKFIAWLRAMYLKLSLKGIRFLSNIWC